MEVHQSAGAIQGMLALVSNMNSDSHQAAWDTDLWYCGAPTKEAGCVITYVFFTRVSTLLALHIHTIA